MSAKQIKRLARKEAEKLLFSKKENSNFEYEDDSSVHDDNSNEESEFVLCVPQSETLQSLIIELHDEIKSLRSEMSDMRKEITELKEGNKRWFTKLTEEVIAVKLENRKHHHDHLFNDEFEDAERLPFASIEDLEQFDDEVQENEDKLRQFKQFIAKTGGDGPAKFLRLAVRKVFSDELASLYSWKGTSSKPSAEKCFLITTIKNICHLNYKSTEKDMNTVLQKHFVHAKDRMTKRKRPY